MSASGEPDALALAQRLGAAYGRAIDAHKTYPTGVAFSGRLRLASLDGSAAAVGADIAHLAAPLAAHPAQVPDAGACLAIGCFANELHVLTGDAVWKRLLTALTDRFVADADVRVEDIFFAATLLGRARACTGDAGYLHRFGDFLARIDTQQASGLFVHCHAAPWLWGRGNAFAAIGLAEAMTYIEDAALRTRCAAMCHAQLEALRAHQHESGLWHQIIDDADTYLEHSASCMFGYAIAKGIRGGWLAAGPWRDVVNRAWRGVAAGIGPAGELRGVCVGTGPLASRKAYVERPVTNGIDARGGAMALWFAVEMACLQGDRSYVR